MTDDKLIDVPPVRILEHEGAVIAFDRYDAVIARTVMPDEVGLLRGPRAPSKLTVREQLNLAIYFAVAQLKRAGAPVYTPRNKS